MRGYKYNILLSLVFLLLVLGSIFVLFNTGSDLAITIILIFIPVMIGISFLIRYLVTVRKRSIREQVMERDIRGIANRYKEHMRILQDLEDKYRISTEEFRADLQKVKEGLYELGCEVTGRLRIDRARLRKVVFSDVEWLNKLFDEITERQGLILYSRARARCEEYLKSLEELKLAGYEAINVQIEQMVGKLEDTSVMDAGVLELAMYLNEVSSLIEEALSVCVRTATDLEVVARERAGADTARVRTDIKLVERNIEHGNYENAMEILKGVIKRLSKALTAEFERYRANAIALVSIVLTESGREDEEAIALGARIEGCKKPSQMLELLKHGAALKSLSVVRLEDIYKRIFELESELRAANPGTDLYPVEYWQDYKMNEIDELKALLRDDERMDEFVRRYRQLASDAYSRLKYDSERLEYIKLRNG